MGATEGADQAMSAAPHRCSGLLGVVAECRDCGWESEARNAMGNAAQHAERTGHHVVVEQAISVGFNCTTDHAALRGKAPHEAGQ